MTVLTWDSPGERFFQAGVDRGVLYIPGGDAVAWSGLTAVDETVDDGSAPYHVDGVKYLDRELLGDFSATIKAFTYPDEFEPFNGMGDMGNGLLAGDQKPKSFSMCYRTRVGNDTEGTDHGYLIHILYNCIALPNAKSFATLDDNVTPVEFVWDIKAVPASAEGYRPTAHLIFNSNELYPPVLATLEDVLYGTDDDDAFLPPLESIISVAIALGMITITDNGDGTWTADGPSDFITMLDATSFQITGVDATFLDADTYEVTSTYLP